MCLNTDAGSLIGTNFHSEAIVLIWLPYMVGSVNEKLCIPLIRGIGYGVNLDATRAVDASTIGNRIKTYEIVVILTTVPTDEAGGVRILAVTILDILYPG